MSRPSISKKERRAYLLEKLNEDPFFTDEELSETFKVSIPTIRLDRLDLGIPELRERVKNVAKKSIDKVKAIKQKDITGKLVDIELGISGVSVLETDDSMAFEGTKVVRGSFIYSFAESLAIAIIDANAALVGVANIKYNIPVNSGSNLVAKAEVKSIKDNKHIVWVHILEKQLEVFRGKFILVSLEKI
jgi:acyl-coenzyme A thioesterase PaaI-like protein